MTFVDLPFPSKFNVALIKSASRLQMENILSF